MLVLVDGCKFSRLIEKVYAGTCAHAGRIALIIGSSGLRRGFSMF